MIEPLRHKDVPGFGAVIFRRTSTQIRQEGGLWDESNGLYRAHGAKPRERQLDWRFPSGARVGFGHMEHERDRFNWDGAQITLLGFDQLEHFTYRQFFHLLGRNRSTCGVRPYVRATCNPDPDSWLADFVAWWIDPKTGYARPKRGGRLRWFVRLGDEIDWASSRAALVRRHGAGSHPLSVTFIPASVQDNRILMETDPGYLAKLRALPRVERERLEKGNWRIRPAAGLYFRRGDLMPCEVVPASSSGGGVTVRCWDLAATEAQPGSDPDWTVGLKMTRAEGGLFFVEDVVRLRGSPHKVERAVLATAEADGKAVRIVLPQDPGQAGKAQGQSYLRLLAGYDVRLRRETGDKVTRAGPVSAQAEAGNVRLLRGPWNGAFLDELENFPPTGRGGHDDQVDALAGAFRELVAMTSAGGPRIR